MVAWPRIWPHVVVASALGALVLVSAEHDGWVRQVWVFIFLCLVPGITVVRFVDSRLGWASALSLSAAVSLTIGGFIAGIGVFTGVWEPKLFVNVVATLSLVVAATALSARGAQRFRRLGRARDERAELQALETIGRSDEDRPSTALPNSRGADATRPRASDGIPEMPRLIGVREGTDMTDRALQAEVQALREQVRQLERELAEYRELAGRLQVEVAMYRTGDELRRTSVPGSRTPAATIEARATLESETILQQAEARLNAALERLRATSDRPASVRAREAP
jgi:hypothetical protein